MRIFTMSEKNGTFPHIIKAVFIIKSYENGSKRDDNFSSLNGTLMNITEWIGLNNNPNDGTFVADVYFKWDCCTHWHFCGEESHKDDARKDSYYHLCGEGFANFIDEMAFVAYVMKTYFMTDEQSVDELDTFDLLKINERYSIEEVEDEPIWLRKIFSDNLLNRYKDE